MTTRHVIKQLPLWVGGDLDPAEAAAVLAHLETCASCRAASEAFQASHAWFLTQGGPPFTLEERLDFRQRVMKQVAAASQEPRARPDLGSHGHALLLIAAGLLTVLLWPWTTRKDIPKPISPPQTTNNTQATLPPADRPLTPPPPANPGPKRHPRAIPPRVAPLENPGRIEFQTDNPNIRIIWLARSEPHPFPEESTATPI